MNLLSHFCHIGHLKPNHKQYVVIAKRGNSFLQMRHLHILGRTYEIDIRSTSKTDHDAGYKIKVYEERPGSSRKFLSELNRPKSGGYLDSATLAIYKGTPLLAVQAAYDQHYFTDTYKLAGLRRQPKPVSMFVMEADASNLWKGVLIENMPDQYLTDKPKYFHRRNSEVSELIPRVLRYNLKKELFVGGDYDFRKYK